MGKPKKGKKGRQDDDFGDDDAAVLDPIAQEDTTESEPVAPTQKTGKKGKKGKKANKDWSDDDDVDSKFAALSIEQDSDVENGEVEEAPIASGKSKKKDKKKKQRKSVSEDEEAEEELPTSPRGMGKPGLSAFAMLDVEDVTDQEDMEEEEEEIKEVKPVGKKKQKKQQKALSLDDDEEVEKEAPPSQPQEQQQKKKGKKDKKKPEEEDIDAILADLEKPAEKTEGKKKKKKKADEYVPIPEQESATAFELVDIENMTQDQIAALLGGDDDDEDDRKKKKKEKKKKKKGKGAEEEEPEKQDENKEEEAEEKEEGEDAVKDEDNKEEEEGSTVKTAAQKKREKRERQKQQKLLEKQKQLKKQDGKPEEVPEKAAEENEAPKEAEAAEKKSDDEGEGGDEGDKKKKKRDRKKKKGEKPEEEEKAKKKPGSKTLKAMQEALQKLKEDEERAIKEQEEKERRIEEALKAKEEEERQKKEKKERDKQKKKEKIEQQKKEGTYKTKAQRDAERRAREMLAARGLQLPQRPAAGEGEVKPKRIIYDRKKKKPTRQGSEELKSPDEAPQSPLTETPTPTPTMEEKSIVDEVKKEEPVEEVLDSWELVEDKLNEDEQEEEKPEDAKEVETEEKDADKEESEEESEEESSEEEEEDEEESSSEESSEEESSEDEDMTADERAFRKAEKRIEKRKELAESKRNKDVLRAPVVCVLGHVDTGKTKILDKLRRTNVQDGEAGGITQQIGATNVPYEAIKDKTSMCKEFSKKELKIPGLLIIDTPGHESFSNLRNRGSSLCDIAILVVDIMHGLEPQTIESINLLKSRKTPFVVALNKIDRLFGWQPNPHTDIMNTIKKQKTNTKLEFEERVQMVTGKFAEQGLNVALFYENKNPREYISMVPTSAHSGDGMGNLVALLCELSQTFLAERIAFVDDLQATVMEVKALPGLGTTIDVIVVNGSIRESQTMIVAGTEGPIVTQIRGLLLPQPMKELRVKGAYIHTKEMKAAQGVKIIAKDLDKALAGLPLYVAKYDDEIAVYRSELEESLEEILKGIKVQQEGVFVQASTLGSLEALLEFLRTSKIPYAGINIGPVHKRDIMRASVMLERDSQYAVILAFDVKVEREAQEMADGLGVRIFTADIIYHLFDAFTNYRAELKKQKQEEFKHVAVFPCKLRVLPNCIFNARNPIVVGVSIEAGFVKEGTPICVPSKEFLEVGRISGLELNHKSVEMARKGQEVCIKIEAIPGDAPKLYGRHFDHTDLLVSKISRQSIDAVKNYFREDMTKTDWQLMVELKKTFEIL